MSEIADPRIDERALLPMIGVLRRLALAYAPAPARPATLALFALDMRLAGVVRGASEPLLAQLRLAWWRDRLGNPSPGPEGEPLLAALGASSMALPALVPLVDGWEAMLGEQPLGLAAFEALAEGRGKAFAALAAALGHEADEDAARCRGKAWALADIAARVGDPDERGTVLQLANAEPSEQARLHRALRPLVVMEGVARRRLRRGAVGPGLTPGDLLAAIRLGIAGR